MIRNVELLAYYAFTGLFAEDGVVKLFKLILLVSRQTRDARRSVSDSDDSESTMVLQTAEFIGPIGIDAPWNFVRNSDGVNPRVDR